jgi:hypothetical protein
MKRRGKALCFGQAHTRPVRKRQLHASVHCARNSKTPAMSLASAIPSIRAERRRNAGQGGGGDFVRQIRPDRTQLLQSRHGQPHRQSAGSDSGCRPRSYHGGDPAIRRRLGDCCTKGIRICRVVRPTPNVLIDGVRAAVVRDERLLTAKMIEQRRVRLVDHRGQPFMINAAAAAPNAGRQRPERAHLTIAQAARATWSSAGTWR